MKNKSRRQPDGSIAIFMKKPGTGVPGKPRETISVFVSAEDFDRVAAIGGTWYARDVQAGVCLTRYAITCFKEGGRKRYVYLHRYIMDAPEELDVDHKDRNGLNCRRENLRVMTHSDNLRNRRKFKRSKRRRRDSLAAQEREHRLGKKARSERPEYDPNDMPF